MNREYKNYREECDCTELARACVPFQTMGQVYCPREALKKGTLFPELYKPYVRNNKSHTGGRYYG